MNRVLGFACLTALQLSAVPQALAAPVAKPVAKVEPAADDLVELKPGRDKMTLVTDGKGHYVAYAPLEQMSEFLFYGDGKRFYQQRVFSGGSEGTIRFSRTMWDPRNGYARTSFEYANKKYTVECGKRSTQLTLVPEAEAKPLLAAAEFHGPKWKWRAYLLARDEQARYYYVDRQREPENSGNFRLFMGPKGALKLQKMTNVVADSQGDIFSTKTGSLRLISGQEESFWVQGKSKSKLTKVPVEENAQLIYGELGVYTGEALGTPCDDL